MMKDTNRGWTVTTAVIEGDPLPAIYRKPVVHPAEQVLVSRDSARQEDAALELLEVFKQERASLAIVGR